MPTRGNTLPTPYEGVANQLGLRVALFNGMSGMSRIVMFALAAGLSMPLAAQIPPAPTDNDFLLKAAEAGVKQFEVGKLASERALNPDVKAFGRRLVVDHSIVNGELLKFSKSRNLSLPGTLKIDPTELIGNSGQPNVVKIDPANMPAASANLMSLEGAAFDRAFIDQMVIDQKDAVDLFAAEADDGKDSEVKEWAEKKLVTLNERLKLAKDLQDKISR